MKKLLKIALPLLLITLLLSGCKSSDYEDAMSALNDSNYDEAIELFISLGDYKDSADQLVDAINKYADKYIEKDKYDDAIALYNQYANYGDFDSIIDELQFEKEQYEVYCAAMDLFNKESIDEGFELLDTLPYEYRNVEKIHQSYNDLKDVPFVGTHTNIQGKNHQQIIFNLIFDIDNECFYHHAYKAVYFSDGTVYKDYNFYLTADDIGENTIYAGKFTWRINDDGKLVETEKGSTAIYH